MPLDPNPNLRIHPHKEQASCNDCNLSDLCLPVRLTEDKIDALSQIVQRGRPLRRGENLYRAGAAFTAIFAVRSGALKSTSLSEDGEEQITAFHLPGEIIGLDAITFGSHPSSAEALETSSLCEIPFPDLEQLSTVIPQLQQQLLRVMSREIHHEQEMMQALARRNAEQRLAIVLLNLSERFAARGLSATRFRLPMSRHDLSNYMGLAPETMSRLFKRFVDQRWITASGREIQLRELDALREMTGNPTSTVERSSRG